MVSTRPHYISPEEVPCNSFLIITTVNRTLVNKYCQRMSFEHNRAKKNDDLV